MDTIKELIKNKFVQFGLFAVGIYFVFPLVGGFSKLAELAAVGAILYFRD